MKTAIVVGATGLIGSAVIKNLLTDNRYAHIHVVVRRPTGLAHPKIKEFVVDFDHLEHQPAALTGDELFCCLGTTLKAAGSAQARRKVDRDLVVSVAEAAQGRATRFVVVSSVGADATSGNAYLRDKGEMENVVAALRYESVIVVQPSIFYGNRKESRPGEQIGIGMARLLAPFLGRYRALSAEKIAAAMIRYANAPLRGLHRFGVKEMEAETR